MQHSEALHALEMWHPTPGHLGHLQPRRTDAWLGFEILGDGFHFHVEGAYVVSSS